MPRFVYVLSLLLAARWIAVAGALPTEAVPFPVVSEGVQSAPLERHAPPRDKWLRVGLIWGATALDLVSSHYALANNPATRESNPILATKDGRFRTGVYLGVSLPLNVLASYANLKYPHSRSIRILTYVTNFAKFGIAIDNFRQRN